MSELAHRAEGSEAEMTNPLMLLSVSLVLYGELGGKASSSGELGCPSVKASSEPRFSEKEACWEASGRLDENLLELVAARNVEGLPDSQLRRHLARLQYASGARRNEFTETINKPYGTMYRRHLVVTLPEETIENWVDEVQSHYRRHRRLCAGATVLTALGWVGGLWIVVKLDRWTLGYHRPAILLAVILVLLCGTGVGWIMVLH